MLANNKNRMFKKITILTLLLFITASFGCGKYNVETNLTEEQIADYEARIQENLEVLREGSLNLEDELTATQTIGVLYENLGEYKKAIKYYEASLELDSTDYLALNNLASLYSRVGEQEKAKEYIAVLYLNNQSSRDVISDAVRIYTENKDYDGAIQIITAYGVYLSSQGEISEEDQSYLSEKYGYIQRYQAKHGN